MLHWIEGLVDATRYWGVALLMAIENIVLPLPSELIMPFSGFESERGRMTLWGVIVAGTIGSVLGALPMYYGARLLGKERVTAWVDRHGRWLLLRGRDLDRANARFERHGGVAVFVSQLLPGLRGLIALPAGFARMNVAMFLLWNFLGTLIWCAVLASLGYLLRAHFAKVHRFIGPVSWIVLAALLAAGLAWAIRRRRKRSR